MGQRRRTTLNMIHWKMPPARTAAVRGGGDGNRFLQVVLIVVDNQSQVEMGGVFVSMYRLENQTQQRRLCSMCR